MTVTRKTTSRVVVGGEINMWTGSGYPVYVHGPVSYPGQFGRGAWYGSDVHPNGSPFVQSPPMPPNVGWWINQPVITGPSSTEMELRFQRETKFQYFGDSGHSGHRRHGLQPPVAPNHPQPSVAPNPPQSRQGGNGVQSPPSNGSGRPHGLQPQPQK